MTETIGGYDYEFIEKLPDDLTCTLCHFAYKHPLQIEDCGRTFCEDCFNQLKDHAVKNSLDLCCPIDRQKIDIARVFRDKSDERRVLNLMVKCPYYDARCDWTGELREVLIHELTCSKNETTLHKELKQLLNSMTELESQVKTTKQKLNEKDEQIKEQEKQIKEQEKQIKELEKQIKELEKQIKEQEKQIKEQEKQIKEQEKQIKEQEKQIKEQEKQIKEQEKQIKEQKKQIKELNEHQDHQIENLQKQIISLQQTQNNMIIPNIANDCNFSSISTAFQWKFNVTEVKSGLEKFSPPFYNEVNTYCFQLKVIFTGVYFRIIVYRYRGEYDSVLSKDMRTTEQFQFCMNLYGKEGKRKAFSWFNITDYSIPKYAMRSTGRFSKIHDDEIVDLTLDNYIHLRCFFQK